MDTNIFETNLPADPAIWSEFEEIWSSAGIERNIFAQKAYFTMYSFLKSWWNSTEELDAKEILTNLMILKNGLPKEKIWIDWIEIIKQVESKPIEVPDFTNYSVNPVKTQKRRWGFWRKG
ncbi:hypothetical protein EQG49_04280 [Periweissella cryptocerci]|uniref:Uncharacterized protein n=1 Tax=Periweissella cryptocerci TaxID=2506420 RepID=A0A4P6YSY1_9LACO|nr:hypothetical protein [Periweissella cryptocerci]QBO35733.1 hypothetical protein EQG49_04280 [Periweissella cryptocerci]